MTAAPQILGVAAAALSVVQTVPYLRDVLHGMTVPHRGTWGVWSLLAIVAFAAQLSRGVNWSDLPLAVQAANVTLVFVLSIKRGTGGGKPHDWLLLSIAASGVAGWALTGDGVLAIVCVILADLIGCALMLPKSWANPWSETWESFALAGGAGSCAAAAAPPGATSLYPVYYGLVNLGIAALLLSRRRSLEATVPKPAGQATVRPRGPRPGASSG